MSETESRLITAGGRITCARCLAKARSGKQCAKPAVSGKRVCRSHGGASCGPKSSAGRQKIRETHWKHGERSAAAIEKERLSAIRLRHLADALRILKAQGTDSSSAEIYQKSRKTMCLWRF